MIEVLSGVTMFTVVVLALVALLLGARRRLVQSGEVTIHINDDPAKALKVAAGNTLLGTLFVDLYPRADKYQHAAVWSFRNASSLAARRPAAALVVNFNRQGLTLAELETLLHEFGHALHALRNRVAKAATPARGFFCKPFILFFGPRQRGSARVIQALCWCKLPRTATVSRLQLLGRDSSGSSCRHEHHYLHCQAVWRVI